MPRLSEHERSDAIGMLKAGMRVSDVARYSNCHPSNKQRLRDLYQTHGTVNDRHRSGRPKMATDLKTAAYVDCISAIFTSTIIVPAGYCQYRTKSRAPRVFFLFLIKNI